MTTKTPPAIPESQRAGHPHDDPRVVALCREHDILGTAMQGLAAVFWREGGSPAPSAPGDAQDGWRIDNSAGRPILVRNNCSVIEAEDAEYVLRVIAADRTRAPTFATSIFGERIGQMMDGSAAPAAGDALPNFDIEAASQKMAECMDYPWAHMPEQGRTHMRKYAQAVIDAALAAQVPQQGEA